MEGLAEQATKLLTYNLNSIMKTFSSIRPIGEYLNENGKTSRMIDLVVQI